MEHLFDRVTDLSLAIQLPANKLKVIAAHRRELGLMITLYACGGQYNALENAPYENLYTMWCCEKIGMDGFLRWALDAFNADSLTSSDHRLYAAGDFYLIYPDDRDAAAPQANSAVRFEKLAEGCRDITKFRYFKANFPEWAEMISTFGRKGILNRNLYACKAKWPMLQGWRQ